MNARLLRQARRGNADAFIALCAPYEGLVYRHCLQLLKNPADAQDAAQEAMLKAYRAIATFEQRSGLATWLFRIAHNVCLDLLKKAYRQHESASLEEFADNGFDPPGDGASPEDAYLQQSEREALRAAVGTLPERQQALLTLRYGEGLSYEQIAKTLRLSLGTVKSALSRAKEELRTLLRPPGA